MSYQVGQLIVWPGERPEHFWFGVIMEVGKPGTVLSRSVLVNWITANRQHWYSMQRLHDMENEP